MRCNLQQKFHPASLNTVYQVSHSAQEVDTYDGGLQGKHCDRHQNALDTGSSWHSDVFTENKGTWLGFEASWATDSHPFKVALVHKMCHQPPAGTNRLQVAVYELEFNVQLVDSLHRYTAFETPCPEDQPAAEGSLLGCSMLYQERTSKVR
jgi:hypothetical protein